MKSWLNMQTYLELEVDMFTELSWVNDVVIFFVNAVACAWILELLRSLARTLNHVDNMKALRIAHSKAFFCGSHANIVSKMHNPLAPLSLTNCWPHGVGVSSAGSCGHIRRSGSFN